jgi:hypothetical protein
MGPTPAPCTHTGVLVPGPRLGEGGVERVHDSTTSSLKVENINIMLPCIHMIIDRKRYTNIICIYRETCVSFVLFVVFVVGFVDMDFWQRHVRVIYSAPGLGSGSQGPESRTSWIK